ncbi:Ubiquitin carboxyl-terminal hydrolase 43, partial [Ophiophagus hannah]
MAKSFCRPPSGQEESSTSGSAQATVQPPKGQSFVQNHFQAQYRLLIARAFHCYVLSSVAGELQLNQVSPWSCPSENQE